MPIKQERNCNNSHHTLTNWKKCTFRLDRKIVKQLTPTLLTGPRTVYHGKYSHSEPLPKHPHSKLYTLRTRNWLSLFQF